MPGKDWNSPVSRAVLRAGRELCTAGTARGRTASAPPSIHPRGQYWGLRVLNIALKDKQTAVDKNNKRGETKPVESEPCPFFVFRTVLCSRCEVPEMRDEQSFLDLEMNPVDNIVTCIG